MEITWDHSLNLVHKFTIKNIERNTKSQELILSWDGFSEGVRQKGSSLVNIPPKGEFSVLDVIVVPGESQRIDVLFSDPIDDKQETIGLVHFTPSTEATVNISSNIISIYPANNLEGKINLNVESSIRNTSGNKELLSHHPI